MGMYDTLSIDNKWISEEKRLPQDKQDYQTKSLECFLEHYDIIEDGRLISNGSDVDYTGEIRFYNLNNSFIAWCVKGVVKEVIDLNI